MIMIKLRNILMKTAQCLFVLIVTTFCAFADGSQNAAAFGINGQLTLTTPDASVWTNENAQVSAWKTNVYQVRLLIESNRWQIVLDSESGQAKTICVSNETVWAAFHGNTQAEGPLNSSEIRLFPGTRPFDLRVEEHLWGAYLSGDYFRGRQAPFKDETGFCMHGPGVFEEVQSGKNALSPAVLRWHNQRADAKSDAPRISGEFLWVEKTNFSGVDLPAKSRLTMTVKYPEKPEIIATISEFTIHQISNSSSSPVYTLGATGRSPVTDFREGNVASRQALHYQIEDGKIPAAKSQPVRETMAMTKGFHNDLKSPWRLVLFAVILGTLAVLSAALISKRKAKDKK